MKKYFYTALALVAMVGCSKDSIETPSMDNTVQSIEISIENITTPTRTEGGITPAADATQLACANIEDLIFLFADANGNIKARKHYSDRDESVTSGILFHTIESGVSQVGVIANYEGAASLTTLAQAEDAWKNESAMIAKPYRNITNTNPIQYGVVAYGHSALIEDPDDCYHQVANIRYKKLKSQNDITVKPHMARIEITHIGYIDDFTTNSTDVALDFEMIGVKGLELVGGDLTGVTGTAISNNAPYTHAFESFGHDTADWDTNNYVLKAKHDHSSATDNNYISNGDGYVWSWNILPQDVSNLVTHLYLKYGSHTSMIHDRTVTINEYKNGGSNITSFESGNIYRFAIDFGKSNLDNADATNHICVQCTVSIANWVINDITVDFVQ